MLCCCQTPGLLKRVLGWHEQHARCRTTNQHGDGGAISVLLHGPHTHLHTAQRARLYRSLPAFLLAHCKTAVVQVGDVLVQKLLLFDGTSTEFRTVKLRPRNPACQSCGTSPSITAQTLVAYDYTAFTGQAADDNGELLPRCQADFALCIVQLCFLSSRAAAMLRCLSAAGSPTSSVSSPWMPPGVGFSTLPCM